MFNCKNIIAIVSEINQPISFQRLILISLEYFVSVFDSERLDICPQASDTRMCRAGRNTTCYDQPLQPAAHFLTMDGQTCDGGQMSRSVRS